MTPRVQNSQNLFRFWICLNLLEYEWMCCRSFFFLHQNRARGVRGELLVHRINKRLGGGVPGHRLDRASWPLGFGLDCFVRFLHWIISSTQGGAIPSIERGNQIDRCSLSEILECAANSQMGGLVCFIGKVLDRLDLPHRLHLQSQPYNPTGYGSAWSDHIGSFSSDAVAPANYRLGPAHTNAVETFLWSMIPVRSIKRQRQRRQQLTRFALRLFFGSLPSWLCKCTSGIASERLMMRLACSWTGATGHRRGPGKWRKGGQGSFFTQESILFFFFFN